MLECDNQSNLMVPNFELFETLKPKELRLWSVLCETPGKARSQTELINLTGCYSGRYLGFLVCNLRTAYEPFLDESIKNGDYTQIATAQGYGFGWVDSFNPEGKPSWETGFQGFDKGTFWVVNALGIVKSLNITQYKLLSLLSQYQGDVVPYNVINNQLMGTDVWRFGTRGALGAVMIKIRRLLEPGISVGESRIKTVNREGLMLV